MVKISSPDLEITLLAGTLNTTLKEKMKLIIQSIKNYFKSKKDRRLEPLFFEKIGNHKTSRDEMLKNLIKALEKNGWSINKSSKEKNEK